MAILSTSLVFHFLLCPQGMGVIALMIVSLMERNIRKNMAEQGVEKLPILPNGMNTKKPTWN